MVGEDILSYNPEVNASVSCSHNQESIPKIQGSYIFSCRSMLDVDTSFLTELFFNLSSMRMRNEHFIDVSIYSISHFGGLLVRFIPMRPKIKMCANLKVLCSRAFVRDQHLAINVQMV